LCECAVWMVKFDCVWERFSLLSNCVLSLYVLLCVLIAFSLVWERRVGCHTLLCALSRYILPARPEAWVKVTFTKVQGSWKVNGAKRTVKVRCVTSILTRFRFEKNEGNRLKVDSLSVNDFKYYYIISVYFLWRWAGISRNPVNTLKWKFEEGTVWPWR